MTALLPDLLDLDLNVIICGFAAGEESASAGHYYARSGNRFWPMLFKCGFTDRVLASHQDILLPEMGIGLTDLIKDQCGVDRRVRPDSQQIEAFWEKMLEFRPKALCFNGKRAAKLALGRRIDRYGIQKGVVADVPTYVATSTSGAASRWWDEQTWKRVARAVI